MNVRVHPVSMETVQMQSTTILVTALPDIPELIAT